MNPEKSQFEDELGELLNRLSSPEAQPPRAADVLAALRRRSVRRRIVVGTTGAVVVLGALMTAWTLHRAGPARHEGSMGAATAQIPQKHADQAGLTVSDLPVLSFSGISAPAFPGGQRLQTPSGSASIPHAASSKGPRVSVTFDVPGASVPRL